MATTTNFGWETPDDTDLVKDGAAAIRTALGGVDTSFVDLKGGTTGQILSKASGTDLDFTWTSPGGGGKVLQVVNATYATQVSSATSTLVDTGLTATITPSATTSKILVLITQNGVSKDTGDTSVDLRLFRNGSQILLITDSAGKTDNTNTSDVGTVGTSYLDSPSSTSALTYKTQFASQANRSRALVQYGRSVASTSMITLLEIGA